MTPSSEILCVTSATQSEIFTRKRGTDLPALLTLDRNLKPRDFAPEIEGLKS